MILRMVSTYTVLMANRLGKYSYEEYPGTLDIYKAEKLIFGK